MAAPILFIAEPHMEKLNNIISCMISNIVIIESILYTFPPRKFTIFVKEILLNFIHKRLQGRNLN